MSFGFAVKSQVGTRLREVWERETFIAMNKYNVPEAIADIVYGTFPLTRSWNSVYLIMRRCR